MFEMDFASQRESVLIGRLSACLHPTPSQSTSHHAVPKPTRTTQWQQLNPPNLNAANRTSDHTSTLLTSQVLSNKN